MPLRYSLRNCKIFLILSLSCQIKMYSYDKCNLHTQVLYINYFSKHLKFRSYQSGYKATKLLYWNFTVPTGISPSQSWSAAKEKANFLLPRKLGCLRASLTPTHLYISTTHPRAMGFHGVCSLESPEFFLQRA